MTDNLELEEETNSREVEVAKETGERKPTKKLFLLKKPLRQLLKRLKKRSKQPKSLKKRAKLNSLRLLKKLRKLRRLLLKNTKRN